MEQNNTTSSRASTWMQDSLSLLGSRSLREICMPGSHDAGMSSRTGGTAFAYDCNTLTQTKTILEQLRFGARYFDVRPIVSGNNFYTGHYSFVKAINSWQGANGISIQSIIDDVNTFTSQNDELVVLYLSHDLDTDLPNDSYSPFSQEQWDNLFAELKGLNNLFVFDEAQDVDLTKLALERFIGNNQAAVVMVVDPSGSDISLGEYANQGFYMPKAFPVYNEYSDTNDLVKMTNDQLKKMKEQKSSPNSCYFLLSWTLTQNDIEATTCQFGTASSILDLANQANNSLCEKPGKLLPACSSQCYPNILYIDNVDRSDIEVLAMAINSKVAGV